MPKAVIHIILDLLFPSKCIGCAKIGAKTCEECIKRLKKASTNCLFCGEPHYPNGICAACRKNYSIEMIIWPWQYQHEHARKLIGLFKYKKMKSLLPLLSKALKEEIEQHNIPKDALIIPIPLHPLREKERGFNQSLFIAQTLGNRIENSVLKRIKDTPQLARAQSREERFRQIKGAFYLAKPDIIKGKNILLVDDVATTGATIAEAARMLKEGGAKKIYAAVVAH